MSITGHVNNSNQKSFNLTTYDKVNVSPSQAKYTFSKANRFPSIKSGCPVSSYDIPGQLSNRSAGMGYGNKVIFKKDKKSPSPDKYNLGSQFDFKEAPSKSGAFGPKKTFCFGAGRDDFSKTVYNTTQMYPDAVVPGPGSYTDGTKLIGVNARKTSLKERKFYLDDDEMAKKLAIPGPGTYNDQQQLHSKGLYVNSEMMNSKAARMNTGRRFKDYGPGVPGPGTYEEIGRIANQVQVCSNFHSTITKGIGTNEKRHQWGGNPRFRTPGPGTYRPPSDFGYLDFKNGLRDNLGGSIMTGFDTSMDRGRDQRSLQLGKLESQAISLQSDKRSHRNKNSIFRTVDEPQSNRAFDKKRSSVGGGHNTSRNAAESTLYSMNPSVETPRQPGASLTPMTSNVDRNMADSPELRTSPRQTKTPAPNSQYQQKFKKAKRSNNLRDMVVIYADAGQKQLLRQEAIATQIRQQHAEKKQSKGAVEIIETTRMASEMGNKPNSRSNDVRQAEPVTMQ